VTIDFIDSNNIVTSLLLIVTSVLLFVTLEIQIMQLHTRGEIKQNS